MEVVGLGYTIWFSSRYLLFKVLIGIAYLDIQLFNHVKAYLMMIIILQKNREELVAKVQVLKQQVLGSNDDW